MIMRLTTSTAAAFAGTVKYLLLGRDLDSFLRFCRTVNHQVHGGEFAIINAPRDQPFEFFRKNEKPAATAITFRKTAHVTPSCAFVEGLAAKLRKVVGARQVHISGAIDATLALDTQRAMTPTVVFGYAMGWDLVELMTSWKQYADKVSHSTEGKTEAKLSMARTTAFPKVIAIEAWSHR